MNQTTPSRLNKLSNDKSLSLTLRKYQCNNDIYMQCSRALHSAVGFCLRGSVKSLLFHGKIFLSFVFEKLAGNDASKQCLKTDYCIIACVRPSLIPSPVQIRYVTTSNCRGHIAIKRVSRGIYDSHFKSLHFPVSLSLCLLTF